MAGRHSGYSQLPEPPLCVCTTNHRASAHRGKGASLYGNQHKYLGNSLTTRPLTVRYQPPVLGSGGKGDRRKEGKS